MEPRKAAKGDLILQVALVVRRRIRKAIGLTGEGRNIKREMNDKTGLKGTYLLLGTLVRRFASWDETFDK